MSSRAPENISGHFGLLFLRAPYKFQFYLLTYQADSENLAFFPSSHFHRQNYAANRPDSAFGILPQHRHHTLDFDAVVFQRHREQLKERQKLQLFNESSTERSSTGAGERCRSGFQKLDSASIQYAVSALPDLSHMSTLLADLPGSTPSSLAGLPTATLLKCVQSGRF